MKLRTGSGVLFLSLLLMIGCATVSRNYGSFLPDEAVKQGFSKYQMDPDTNYFFSGSDLNPNAIMGLKKKYILDNRLWQPITDAALFQKLVDGMQHKASDLFQSLYGFEMMSPDGEKLGVWYSLLSAPMRLQMGGGNKVVVYTPGPVYPDDDDAPDRHEK